MRAPRYRSINGYSQAFFFDTFQGAGQCGPKHFAEARPEPISRWIIGHFQLLPYRSFMPPLHHFGPGLARYHANCCRFLLHRLSGPLRIERIGGGDHRFPAMRHENTKVPELSCVVAFRASHPAKPSPRQRRLVQGFLHVILGRPARFSRADSSACKI